MIKTKKRKTRVIKVGNIAIGGNNPVAVQSMLKTKASDLKNTLIQLKELETTGCEIVRLAVKDQTDVKALKKIKQKSKIPLVADIHFDWRLALLAIDNGVDKIRLNPGNIYKKEQVRQIAREAKNAGIPIRVGLNSGSLPGIKNIFVNQRPIAGIMVKAAVNYIKILEKVGFNDIVVSLKTSDIFSTMESYRQMTEICDYPFHLGVTASGGQQRGIIKSAIAISSLLLEGIGDTIRVSLTEKPAEEVKAAKVILETLGLRCFSGFEIISCPTCGRCEANLVKIVKDLERKLCAPYSVLRTGRPLKVAVMGCVVNGPGEAKEADIGLAFGKREGLLFKKGRPIKKISHNRCADLLLTEIKQFYKA
ncbi:MAG: 4-hydroxy-3-methylbut-2-en-1-yl diphosphate synthase [Candidatus Omnitrophota bacterium]|nr:MAG: 4-hydroxy-3-methylbut-2-en-1-yl diphosphate synthase [Candidatus Omnitrophota bacterium]